MKKARKAQRRKMRKIIHPFLSKWVYGNMKGCTARQEPGREEREALYSNAVLPVYFLNT